MWKAWLWFACLAVVLAVVYAIPQTEHAWRFEQPTARSPIPAGSVAADGADTAPDAASANHNARSDAATDIRARLAQLEREEANEMGQLFTEELLRLESLREAGVVATSTVIVARLEAAVSRLALASASERWRLLRLTDGWRENLQAQTDRLYKAGFVSRSEAEQTTRALTALREGERWLLRTSPEPSSPAEHAAPTPPEGTTIADVRARNLRRQLAVLESAASPDLSIRRLLLQARLGHVPFDTARKQAEKELERASEAERPDLRALVALFDWYDWLARESHRSK
jgi:hypothetical protein